MVSLEEISESIVYGLNASATNDEHGPRFLRITDIHESSIDWNTVPSCECSEKELEKFSLSSGDIVFARTGATTGKSCLIRDCPTDSVFASYLIRVRLNEKADAKYISHFFQSPMYWAQIRSTVVGAAQPGINATKLKKMQIPLPPIDEQKRIATILDKISETNDAISVIHNSKQELIRSTFLDMFGDMITNPMNWPIMKLGEVCDPQLGKAISKEAKLCLDPSKYLRNANVQWRKIVLHDLKEMDFKDSEKEKLSLSDGDVLATEGGDVGRCAIWKHGNQEIYFQNSLHRIRVNLDILTPEYLVEYFAIMSERGGLIRETTQVTIAHLTGQKLKKLPVPIPPLALQHKFTQILNNIQSISDENIRHSQMLHRSITQMMLS